MVKIQYASDLHLEFMENTLYLETHPLQPVADILVLAGDTGYLGDEGFVKHPFWDWASENFKEVIVIPGNHEFYWVMTWSNSMMDGVCKFGTISNAIIML